MNYGKIIVATFLIESLIHTNKSDNDVRIYKNTSSGKITNYNSNDGGKQTSKDYKGPEEISRLQILKRNIGTSGEI